MVWETVPSINHPLRMFKNGILGMLQRRYVYAPAAAFWNVGVG